MSALNKVIIFVCSLPKTLYFNFHYFDFKKAIRLPVVVSYKVNLKKLGEKGSITCPNKAMSIKLGFSNGSFSMGCKKRSTFYHEENAKIIFSDKVTICNPFYLTVNHSGIVSFGNNFQGNTNFVISCANRVEFSDNCLVGWNVTIIDGDGHSICTKDNDKTYNLPQPIIIGKHVWVSSNATILKGSAIPDGTIVSSNALVTSRFEEPDTIIGGVPAIVIKRGIYWKEKWLI